MITAEQERELIVKARAGDRQAAADLLEAHEGFLYQEARKMRGIEREDAVQEAKLAAFEAIRDFDVSRNLRFLTFASRKVVWTLKRVRDDGGTIRIPQYCNYQRNPKDYQQKADRARRLASLDKPQTEDGRGLREILVDAFDLFADLDSREKIEWVNRAMQRLDDKERAVIRGRMDGQILEEIGQRMGLTRERIRQIEAKAHHKIREYARRTRSSIGCD
jgi:RNA polymerase sigma factor (sigma-70 family)